MLRDAAIVCIGAIDWDFNWQLQQEVASAFAAAGHRVLFVENTGVRRPQWKDLPRLAARLRNARRANRADTGGVDVYSPLLIPLPYSRAASRFNAAAMLRRIRRWLGRDSGGLIIITFLPTPLSRMVIKALDPVLVVYYAVDCLFESSPGARRLRVHEEALFRDADLVFTTSDALRSFAQNAGAQPELLHHGVRFEEFQRARQEPNQSPGLLERLQRPVVGFVGSVRREIDLELVAAAAKLATDLEFVFVGPIVTAVGALAALPNVHFLAPVPHADVARYMVRFDVGVLPYVLNSYTAHIMPAKLKEYLAAGLPIVATRLPEICRFADEHQGVIAFADGAEAFVAALRHALAQNGPSQRQQRAEVAELYDWSRQIESMRLSMEAALRECSAPK